MIHVPINRLPPDILFEVLQHRDCDEDLVAATHVCHYWRSTLIYTPYLWTLHQFRSICDLDRSRTYLERSKSTTIDIEIHLDSVQVHGALQHLVPLIPRTRSLTIHSSNKESDVTSLLLCQSVPSLEHLTIEGHRPKYSLNNFLGEQAPSLRSITITGVCPLLGSPFPLPSLTDLDLYFTKDMGLIHISSLFGLFSRCNLLQKACIGFSRNCSLQQDVPLDQTVSLDSLVELACTYTTCDPFIPLLNLPHLKRLHVSSVDKLVHLLPQNGHVLLSRTTSMFHAQSESDQTIKLSGNGVEISFDIPGDLGDTIPAGWLECIPFRQIEYLKFDGSCIFEDYPFPLFKNLTTFNMVLWNEGTAAQVLALLGAKFSSPSLREIVYNYPFCPTTTELFTRPLIEFSRKMELDGHKLEMVTVLSM